MIVEAVHPAWRRHRPAGARTVRDALAKVSSRVSLRVVDPAELRPVGTFTATRPAYEHRDANRPPAAQAVVDHGGARYVEMVAPRTGGGDRPVRVQELLDYLAGELTLPKSMAMLALDNAFVGSPVRDLWGVASLSGTVDDPRGVAIPDGKAGLVERDGHPEATAALQAFLDREILVSGEGVYQRFRPYARAHVVRRVNGRGEFAVSLDAGVVADGPIPFVPTRREEARVLAGYDGRTGFVEGAEACLALLPEGHDDGEDVRRVTRHLLGMAARWLRSGERGQRASKRDPADTVRLAAELIPWHMAARIGALPDADYPDAARRLAHVLDHLAEQAPPAPIERAGLAQARAYMQTVAVPRLVAGPSLDTEDEAAIGAVAP